MHIQPKGFKRDRLYSGVNLAVKRRIREIAAQHDCSMSYVSNTLLADKLGIKEQVPYYEINERNKKRTAKSRRNIQVVGIESRKRRTG